MTTICPMNIFRQHKINSVIVVRQLVSILNPDFCCLSLYFITLDLSVTIWSCFFFLYTTTCTLLLSLQTYYYDKLVVIKDIIGGIFIFNYMNLTICICIIQIQILKSMDSNQIQCIHLTQTIKAHRN